MAMTEADGGYTPTSPDRTIRPRRGLPNGRAVVGALLVVVAAVAAFAAAGRGEGGPGRSYLVVARRVQAGTAIGAEDLSLDPMLLSPAAAGNAVASRAGVEGATAIHDLAAGDLLSTHDFVPGPTIGGETVGAIHELALPVPRNRIAAHTGPGDRVTVLATLGLDDGRVTVVAVEDAVVLGWATDNRSSGAGVLTLALDDARTAVALAHLTLEGDITVVRTTRAIDDEYPPYFSGLGGLGGLGAAAGSDGRPPDAAAPAAALPGWDSAGEPR